MKELPWQQQKTKQPPAITGGEKEKQKLTQVFFCESLKLWKWASLMPTLKLFGFRHLNSCNMLKSFSNLTRQVFLILILPILPLNINHHCCAEAVPHEPTSYKILQGTNTKWKKKKINHEIFKHEIFIAGHGIKYFDVKLTTLGCS